MTDYPKQAEALRLLDQVVQDMINPPFDLKANLRRCQHVCQILDWQPACDWFHQEINGYYSDTPLPDYRKIPGQQKWLPGGTTSDKYEWMLEELTYGVDAEIFEVEPDILEVAAGVEWLKSHSQDGYTEDLGKRKMVPLRGERSTLPLERKRVFSAAAIANSISQIEMCAFDFASRSYAQLRFGDIVGGIWSRYRQEVDAQMTTLNLADHLASVENALLSDNPEDWRSAAFECRNLLNDLANHLWKDDRPRYEHLEGSSEEGTLDVSHGKFGNRIAAYLHQKGVTGTSGRFLRQETIRLAKSIHALIAFQSTAHEPITRQDAQSITIATYILVGEMARRTDLEPVEEYGPPAIGES